MAQDVQLPDESQRKAFIEKLAQFRQTLAPDQQQMLDIMALSTFRPREGDVQGYTAYWTNWGPLGPGWYQSGWIVPWNSTPYQDTAYSLNAGPDGRYLR